MGLGAKKNLLLLPILLCFVSLPSRAQLPPTPTPTPGPAPCNPIDLRSLTTFLQSLLSHSLLWPTNSSSCCSWPGVQCSGSAQRVTALRLSNLSLSGSIPDSVASLDQLRLLNLSSNLLSGPVPPQLLRLQHLQDLDLSLNSLNGTLPSATDLPSIRIFNLSGNSFDGPLPSLDKSSNLKHFSIADNSFSGPISAAICGVSAAIQTLQLSSNSFSGALPYGFGNCSSLRVLALDLNHFAGNLPDDLFGLRFLAQLNLQENMFSGKVSERFGNLSSLVDLDLSLNRFSGAIPDIFGNLPLLQHLSAHSNFFTGQLPQSFSNLSMLNSLNLRNNSLGEEIDLNCTEMAHLSSLDLGSNKFRGWNLDNLSSCKEMKFLNLARNTLDVQIPEGFGNLQALTHLSISSTGLHDLRGALTVLQRCRSLKNLVLTLNFRGETMPQTGIQPFENIKLLVIANCGLTGVIPPWLAQFTTLQLLDLSWNHLEGTVPHWLGYFDSLFYLDLSNNSLSGEIPESLTQLKSLISRNVLEELAPADFPFFIKRHVNSSGLQFNKVSSFRPTLDLNHNKLTGTIPIGFGRLKKLHVLDLSHNMLSGSIPAEFSGMKSMEVLYLSFNHLSGTIPVSLTNLTFLSDFNVAHNELWGSIPEGGQFLTFPNSSFEGNEGLCGRHLQPCDHTITTSIRRNKERRSKLVVVGMALGIGLGSALLLALFYIFVSRTEGRRTVDIEREESTTEKQSDISGSKLVLLFHNKENKEVTIDDLLKSTNNFNETNIIGCGGFGLVYKAYLPDGRKVAIKRMSGDCGQMEREFQAEVEALSRAQHKNLVSLQGYCRYKNDRLLIYSYMENGSLDYWLHEKPDGGSMLNWNMRLRIAQGAARALAYLHQSCQPHILHRDIKSSNILLDGSFEAHLADFGLARLILPYDTHVTTDLVGTLGYIPPEYGQASVATFKGDVYSFGVVLLELLTGMRPIDMCKPKECRDLISWVYHMKQEKRETEVFDSFIYAKEHSKQMILVLDIACTCLHECPKLRPLVQDIVLWLDTVGIDCQENVAIS